MGGVMYRFLCVLFVSLSCFACDKTPLNPTQLTGDDSVKLAVDVFLRQAQKLAVIAGYDSANGVKADPNVSYQNNNNSTLYALLPKYRRSPNEHINFGVGTYPEKGTYKDNGGGYSNKDDFQKFLKQEAIQYVRLGHNASVLICRNFLLGNYEKNAYINWLKNTYSGVVNLTGIMLAFLDPNKTIFKGMSLAAGSGAQVESLINSGFDEYSSNRFLKIEHHRAALIVEKAQRAWLEEFINDAKGKEISANNINALNDVGSEKAYFAWAVSAVHRIEYQCTRPGLDEVVNDIFRDAQKKKTEATTKKNPPDKQ
jgi:hypothetical protein